MSALLFKFQEDDPIVTNYVPATTRAAITTWQAREDYDFELHSGHLTGYPIYVRAELWARATSNIPKFDTLNKSASDYDAITKFANEDKLSQLSNPAKTDLLRVIRDNWVALSELAQNFWNGTPVSTRTPEEIEMEAWANAETADRGPIEMRNLADFRKSYFL
jgi:hypothetical protein